MDETHEEIADLRTVLGLANGCFVPTGQEDGQFGLQERLNSRCLAVSAVSEQCRALAGMPTRGYHQERILGGLSANPKLLDLAKFETLMDREGFSRAVPRSNCRLAVDAVALSVATGGIQTMQLDAGSDFAGYNYLVLGSLSGTKPAQHFGRIRLALVRDTYFTFLFTNPNTLVQGSIGILDDRGRAVARFVLPRSSLEVPVGLQVQHAFVVFRIGQPMLYAASNTVSLLLR